MDGRDPESGKTHLSRDDRPGQRGSDRAGGAGRVVFWRLSSGPVKVDFLTPPIIKQMLNNAETGVRISIGDTVLNWGGSERDLEPGAFNFRAFDIRARDVRFHGRNGALIAAVPALGISFDMRGLLRGQIQPTVLTLVRPELRLQRTADGIDVDVQTEDLAVEQGDIDPTAEVLKALQLPPGSQPGPLSRLTEVRVKRRAADAGRSGGASGLAGAARRRDAQP